MVTVTEIKQAILGLPNSEYDQIIAWLHELEEQEWDRQIETDAASGKLDFLVPDAQRAKLNGTLEDLYCIAQPPISECVLLTCLHPYKDLLTGIFNYSKKTPGILPFSSRE